MTLKNMAMESFILCGSYSQFPASSLREGILFLLLLLEKPGVCIAIRDPANHSFQFPKILLFFRLESNSSIRSFTRFAKLIVRRFLDVSSSGQQSLLFVKYVSKGMFVPIGGIILEPLR